MMEIKQARVAGLSSCAAGLIRTEICREDLDCQGLDGQGLPIRWTALSIAAGLIIALRRPSSRSRPMAGTHDEHALVFRTAVIFGKPLTS
jgi:hypothetical protein